MSLFKQELLRKRHYLSLLILVSSACVTIQDAKVCSVAGVITSGAICAHTLTPETEDMDMNQFLDFLEAQSERPDPNNPGKTLPAHGAAICMSPQDWNTLKTELELACREMGSHCSYNVKKAISHM